MGRFWWDDMRLRARSAGPVNVRFLYWLLAAVMTASATGGAYALTAEHRAADEAPQRTVPLRVMPLGDSITLGADVAGGFSGGWRPLLWDRLVTDDHLDVRFVGRQNSGTPPLAHEGYGGLRIDEIRELVDGAITAAEPDVVLLHIGTNDIGQNHDLDGAPARLRDLAARICTDQPRIVLVVASIIPISGEQAQVDRYNATIPTMVGGLQRSGCDARFVDMHDAVASTALFDGVHPGPAGYAAMADVWYPVVRDVYDHPGPAQAGSVDDDVLDYTGYWTRGHDLDGAYLGAEHRSSSTGDSVTWSFRGTGIELRGATGPAGGIASVSIDGGIGVPVDFYTADAAEQTLVYRSAVLAADTTHTIRVRVTGERDPASVGSVVSVDRLGITGRGV